VGIWQFPPHVMTSRSATYYCQLVYIALTVFNLFPRKQTMLELNTLGSFLAMHRQRGYSL